MAADSSQELQKCVDDIVSASGYKLYDLDLPRSESIARGASSLKIFISKAGVGQACNVNLDDCVTVTRALDQSETFNALLPNNCTVEVSSPGINRRLRTKQQFSEALGESVKLTLSSTEHGGVIKGVLKEVSDQCVSIEEKQSKTLTQVAWSNLRRAQVEYTW